MIKRFVVALTIAMPCVSAFAEPAPEYESITADFNFADEFAACHPQLAVLQAYDEMPFPEAPEPIARRALNSRIVTPVIFPVNPKIFAPNQYAIHSIPCADEALGLCHYLGVMPTLGLPRNRVYGPLISLACQ